MRFTIIYSCWRRSSSSFSQPRRFLLKTRHRNCYETSRSYHDCSQVLFTMFENQKQQQIIMFNCYAIYEVSWFVAVNVIDGKEKRRFLIFFSRCSCLEAAPRDFHLKIWNNNNNVFLEIVDFVIGYNTYVLYLSILYGSMIRMRTLGVYFLNRSSQSNKSFFRESHSGFCVSRSNTMTFAFMELKVRVVVMATHSCFCDRRFSWQMIKGTDHKTMIHPNSNQTALQYGFVTVSQQHPR